MKIGNESVAPTLTITDYAGLQNQKVGYGPFKIDKTAPVIAVVASEIAFWTDQETHQNPAIEVLRALRPSMLGVRNAMLLAVSSPYRRKGVHFDMIDTHWAKDGDRILALRASTMAMRPDESDDFRTITPDLSLEGFPTFDVFRRPEIVDSRTWPRN